MVEPENDGQQDHGEQHPQTENSEPSHWGHPIGATRHSVTCLASRALTSRTLAKEHSMPEGRLANPDCTLGTDPRSDPRMVAALAPYGLDGLVPEFPVTADSPLADRLAFGAPG